MKPRKQCLFLCVLMLLSFMLIPCQAKTAEPVLRGQEYRIDAVTVRDSIGQSIPGELPHSGFYGEVQATNLRSSTTDLLVLASYDHAGQQIDLSFLYTNSQPGESFTLGNYFDNRNGQIGKLKAFIIPRLGSLTPLSNALEYPSGQRTEISVLYLAQLVYETQSSVLAEAVVGHQLCQITVDTQASGPVSANTAYTYTVDQNNHYVLQPVKSSLFQKNMKLNCVAEEARAVTLDGQLYSLSPDYDLVNLTNNTIINLADLEPGSCFDVLFDTNGVIRGLYMTREPIRSVVILDCAKTNNPDPIHRSYAKAILLAKDGSMRIVSITEKSYQLLKQNYLTTGAAVEVPICTYQINSAGDYELTVDMDVMPNGLNLSYTAGAEQFEFTTPDGQAVPGIPGRLTEHSAVCFVEPSGNEPITTGRSPRVRSFGGKYMLPSFSFSTADEYKVKYLLDGDEIDFVVLISRSTENAMNNWMYLPHLDITGESNLPATAFVNGKQQEIQIYRDTSQKYPWFESHQMYCYHQDQNGLYHIDLKGQNSLSLVKLEEISPSSNTITVNQIAVQLAENVPVRMLSDGNTGTLDMLHRGDVISLFCQKNYETDATVVKEIYLVEPYSPSNANILKTDYGLMQNNPYGFYQIANGSTAQDVLTAIQCLSTGAEASIVRILANGNSCETVTGALDANTPAGNSSGSYLIRVTAEDGTIRDYQLATVVSTEIP